MLHTRDILHLLFRAPPADALRWLNRSITPHYSSARRARDLPINDSRSPSTPPLLFFLFFLSFIIIFQLSIYQYFRVRRALAALL